MSAVRAAPPMQEMRSLPRTLSPDEGAVCPDVHIRHEAHLFPVAVAEDGSTLPSQAHPSHPYGDIHLPAPSYVSRFKVPRTKHAEASNETSTDRIAARVSQTVAPNRPRWPFARYGPGPGGPAALTRSELARPWRPYRLVWNDLAGEEAEDMTDERMSDGSGDHISIDASDRTGDEANDEANDEARQTKRQRTRTPARVRSADHGWAHVSAA